MFLRPGGRNVLFGHSPPLVLPIVKHSCARHGGLTMSLHLFTFCILKTFRCSANEWHQELRMEFTVAATEHRGMLRAALISSLILLLLNIFEWNVVDWLSVFCEPFVLGVAWLAFIGVGITSFLHLARHWRDGYPAFLPMLVCELMFGFILFFPYTQVWLQGNFYWYKSAREAIVQEVQSGSLDGALRYGRVIGSARLSLGADDPYVSMGGNELIVEHHDGMRYIFFYTFRGILDNASGYLYVPEGGDPGQFGDVRRLYRGNTPFKIEEHWYFLGKF
jgi:hypothetical protein